MSSVKSVWFLLFVALLCPIHGNKMCDFTDDDCMTKGAQRVFQSLVKGIDGLFDPTDTIYVKEVKGFVEPNVEYILDNATMSQISECNVTKLRCDGVSFFDYYLLCPELVIVYNYKAKGNLGTIYIDGGAQTKLTLNDYLINIKGGYETYIDEKDNKLRAHPTNYFIKTEPKGKVIFSVSNVVKENQEKSEQAVAYANQHWREIETYMRSPFIESFFKQYMNKVDIYFRAIPFENTFYY